MRRAALLLSIASSAIGSLLTPSVRAECRPTSPCVDAEPMWQSPSAVRLNVVSDPSALKQSQLALGATFVARHRPAVLNVPSPNERGRDVSLIKNAFGWSVAARFGIGHRLELTALAAGLSQQGAGIKGVTSQSAPGIDSPSLQDPRIGFGYALNTHLEWLGAKVRFEAKLPLGNEAALAGENGFVASPSFALASRSGQFFAGLELGARLRNPSDFYGLRVGSQALIATGLGYELAGPRLAFALEIYALPSLVDGGPHGDLPAEWLFTTRFAPRLLHGCSLGAGAGAGIPLTPDAQGRSLAFGLPSFRGLFYVRYSPSRD